MQKQQSSSTVYGLYDYSIAPQFLDSGKYKRTHENNQRATGFYQTLCLELENYYKNILEVPAKCKQLIDSNPHQDKWEIKKFKSFLSSFFEILNLISEYQVEGISSIRANRVDVDCDEFSFYSFLSKIERYSHDQQIFKQKSLLCKRLKEELQAKETFLKKRLKKAQYAFDGKLIGSQISGIVQKLGEKSQLQSELSVCVQKISLNSEQFDKDLMFLRQNFIRSKYEQLQRIALLCKNSKQSLMQIFTYLFDYIENNKNIFKVIKVQCLQKNELKEMEYSKLSEYIISETNNYNKILEEYIQILNNLINSLTVLSHYSKDIRVKQMEFIQSLHRFYEYEECDISEVANLLNLYNSFLRDLGELGDKLLFSVNTIMQLQKNINKCTEMTLTLIKCSPERRNSPKNSKRKASFSDKEIEGDSNKYLDILHDEMYPTYIQNILSKVCKDFRDTMTRMRDSFLVIKPNKRKTLNNSMSISYISETNCPQEMKPSKYQKWLWKDWREELKRDTKHSEDSTFFNELIKLVTLSKKEDKQVQNLSCMLHNRKTQGILRLRENSLVFEANDQKMLLFVPFNEIDNVDMEFNMMTKALMVQTNLGLLTFVDSTDGGIKRFYVSIKRAMDVQDQNNNGNQPMLAKVALSPQQLDFISKRRAEIEKDLQDIQQYEKTQALILQDVDIQQFFKVIYSGDPVNIGGKDYQNFTHYMAKKYQNYNEVFRDFSPPGPEFYTGIEGVSFLNCPLYSEKVIECDHSLPKIPFIPDHCHNTQTVRVYWVSHEEFHIKQTNVTSNVPFTQNFNLVGLVTVKQLQQNLEVLFHMKLVELKDFSMKGMIYDQAIGEYKKGGLLLIEHIKKVMARHKRRGIPQVQTNQDALHMSLNSQNTIIKQYKKAITTLQSKNTYLKYILLAVLIINIALFYFF